MLRCLAEGGCQKLLHPPHLLPRHSNEKRSKYISDSRKENFAPALAAFACNRQLVNEAITAKICSPSATPDSPSGGSAASAPPTSPSSNTSSSTSKRAPSPHSASASNQPDTPSSLSSKRQRSRGKHLQPPTRQSLPLVAQAQDGHSTGSVSQPHDPLHDPLPARERSKRSASPKREGLDRQDWKA